MTMEETWLIDRFRFAAKTVAEWTRDYGKIRAEEMLRDARNGLAWSTLTTYAAFETAWGR